MLQWFHRLMPRQAQFYPLFERHAAVVVCRRALAPRNARGRRSAQAALPGHCGARARSRRHRAGGSHQPPHHLHYPVRPRRHPEPDYGDGRFDRPDAADGQGDRAVRGDDLRRPRCAQWPTPSWSVPSLCSARSRCCPSSASNAAALNEIGLQITRIEGDADEMHDRGLERLYQKAKAGDRHGVHSRQRDLQSSGEHRSTGSRTSPNEIQGIVIEHV